MDRQEPMPRFLSFRPRNASGALKRPFLWRPCSLNYLQATRCVLSWRARCPPTPLDRSLSGRIRESPATRSLAAGPRYWKWTSIGSHSEASLGSTGNTRMIPHYRLGHPHPQHQPKRFGLVPGPPQAAPRSCHGHRPACRSAHAWLGLLGSLGRSGPRLLDSRSESTTDRRH